MVLARSAEAASRIKTLALHGMSRDAWKRFSDSGYRHYLVEDCGYKYNMTDLQAGIGIHQLARIEASSKRREEIWHRYDSELACLPISTPVPVQDEARHARHLYTVLVDEQRTGCSRDTVLERMTEENIGVGVHYVSIPEHPYYRSTFGWRPEDYPNAFRIGRETMSLPVSSALTDEDVSDVIAAMSRVLGRG